MWFGKENKKTQLIDVALDLQREAETREAVAKAAKEMGLKDEYLKAAQEKIDEEAMKEASRKLDIRLIHTWHITGWVHMGCFIYATVAIAGASWNLASQQHVFKFFTCWALVLIVHLAYVGYQAYKLIEDAYNR